DHAGAPTWSASLRALVPGGRMVVCGATGGGRVELSLPRLFFRQHEVIGSTMASYREFAQVAALVAGGLPVLVDRVLPGLDQLPSALSRMAAGEHVGKIVLRH
ncbi:MAG: zinc-binding dehydrogenase, partial [Acidimicrobiales bacterium]